MKQASKIKEVFPDGANEKDYTECGRWRPERWAWEFLRRNTAFQTACDSVMVGVGDANESDALAKHKVAKEFGLFVFKDYREHFMSLGHLERPRFSSAFVFCKANIEPPPAEPKLVRTKLMFGHIQLWFDLSQTVEDKNSLDAMIRRAGEILRASQREYLKLTGVKSLENPKVHPQHFLRDIRILDLLASGHSQTDTLRIVNHAPLDLDRQQIRDKFKKQIPHALSVASSGYRNIATMPPAPSKPGRSPNHKT